MISDMLVESCDSLFNEMIYLICLIESCDSCLNRKNNIFLGISLSNHVIHVLFILCFVMWFFQNLVILVLYFLVCFYVVVAESCYMVEELCDSRLCQNTSSDGLLNLLAHMSPSCDLFGCGFKVHYSFRSLLSNIYKKFPQFNWKFCNMLQKYCLYQI